MLVRHDLFPCNQHTMRVLDGDAQDSIIITTYEKNELGTILYLSVEAHLHGYSYL